jgi:hypothetical protein
MLEATRVRGAFLDRRQAYFQVMRVKTGKWSLG